MDDSTSPVYSVACPGRNGPVVECICPDLHSPGHAARINLRDVGAAAIVHRYGVEPENLANATKDATAGAQGVAVAAENQKLYLAPKNHSLSGWYSR
jgi:hypothetical protein